MKTQELREAWSAKVAKAKSIRDAANGGNLNDQEADAITALMEEAKELRGQIDAAEKKTKAAGDLDAALKLSETVQPRLTRDEVLDLHAEREYKREELMKMRPWEFARRSGKMLAFENTEIGRQKAYRSGMFLRATLFGDQNARQWCQSHEVPIEIGAVMGGTNTAGEYFVPEEMAQAIIDLRETYGIARQLASIEPMSSDTKLINRRVSGLTAYAVGRVQTVTVTASDLAFGQIELSAKTWAALCLISRDFSDDATISMADRVVDEMAYAFAEKEDDCYFNGNGTSTYHGIWGILSKIIDGTHTAGAVDAASGHDTFAELDADDLDTLLAAAPQYVLESPNACFVCSTRGWAQTFLPIIRAAGGTTMSEVSGTGRAIRSYLGWPVKISQKMPTASSDISDTAMILFGDFKRGSVIGDRMGFSAQVLNERYAELRQIGVIGATRFDINIHGLGDTTTAGPILALIGE